MPGRRFETEGLGVLYDLSPGQYPTPQGYETDLVGLAEQIVEEDPMVW